MRSETRPPDGRMARRTISSLLFGVGLGAFFDGIVLHQLLQWHHLVSVPVPPDDLAAMELNVLADGLFHVLAWIATVAGLLLLLLSPADGRPAPGRRFAGGILIGWGGFNLVEGLIDHHLLGIHHVRPGPDELLYDVAFLAWGAAMVAAGTWMRRPTSDTALSEPTEEWR